MKICIISTVRNLKAWQIIANVSEKATRNNESIHLKCRFQNGLIDIRKRLMHPDCFVHYDPPVPLSASHKFTLQQFQICELRYLWNITLCIHVNSLLRMFIWISLIQYRQVFTILPACKCGDWYSSAIVPALRTVVSSSLSRCIRFLICRMVLTVVFPFLEQKGCTYIWVKGLKLKFAPTPSSPAIYVQSPDGKMRFQMLQHPAVHNQLSRDFHK